MVGILGLRRSPFVSEIICGLSNAPCNADVVGYNTASTVRHYRDFTSNRSHSQLWQVELTEIQWLTLLSSRFGLSEGVDFSSDWLIQKINTPDPPSWFAFREFAFFLPVLLTVSFKYTN